MKPCFHNLITTTLVAAGIFAGGLLAKAQSPVLVDPAKAWGGFMNVFNLPADGGLYQFSSGWGGGDLRAVFSGDLLTLKACTNVSNPSDAYWVKPDGSGNKQMEASWYVDTTNLVGSNVTFSGNVVDYSLTTNQTCRAFIKVFNASYSTTLQQAFAPLTNGNQFFTVNLTATNLGAAHVQYGFVTLAPNAPWTNSPESLASITIRTNALDPLNIAVNPSFESGLAGWTAYGNGGNIESQGNTYYNGGNPVGASNVLVYSGIKVQKVFPQFTGGANYSGVYQDIPTGAGSVWQASAKFLTHGQDQIGVGAGDATNQCWLEVTFRDASDTVLATYRSQTIDNSSPTNTWLDMTVTNDVVGGINLTSVVGTTKLRLQEVYYQPFNYGGGSVYADAVRLDNLFASDPNISTLPVNQTKIVGQRATFTVVATGVTALSYQWKRSSTNMVNGGNVSGATTSALTLSNVQKSDATLYTVTVSDTAGSLDASASLIVKTPAEAANLLDNPGFELGVYAPWATFNGGGLRTTNDFYAFDPSHPVSVYEGNYVSVVFNGGEYNGAYQDVPASPGQTFTADGWFYVSQYEAIFGNTTCWLEVQFRNGGTPLALYKSDIIGSDLGLPMDTWYDLQATNGFAGDFVTPIGNSYYLVAPPGTTTIRYQVTMHVLGGSGSVYYDAMSLLRKIPVTVTVARSGGNVNLSWPTQGGTSYQVLYRDNITDAWAPLGSTIAGDGTVKSVSYPASGNRRFYTVQTL